MKVIQNGNDVLKRVTCSGCDSVLEYSKADLREITKTSETECYFNNTRREHTHLFEGIICPVCNNKIELEHIKILNSRRLN